MPVDNNFGAKRFICSVQVGVTGIGHGSPPEIAGAGVNQGKTFLGLETRKSFKPAQAFFTNACDRGRDALLDHGENWRELRLRGGEFSQTFGRPEHFVCIAANSRPTEGTNLIDDLRRVSAARGQVAAVENNVRRNLLQVGKNCLEGSPIAVNVGNDCDSHYVLSAAPFAIIGGRVALQVQSIGFDDLESRDQGP